MKKKLKEFIFRNMKFFGPSICYRLDQLSYLIRASDYFTRDESPVFESRITMYEYLLKELSLETKNITYLEFGVWMGETINWWSNNNKNINSSFFGFDSFEGLPQKWGKRDIGAFSTNGVIPKSDDTRVNFIAGWYDNTLSAFIARKRDLLSGNKIIHMDSDLYSSTLFVLTSLSELLIKGDIIFFDDFFSIRNNSEEFRAFMDFSLINNRKFHCLAKTSTGQIAFEIL